MDDLLRQLFQFAPSPASEPNPGHRGPEEKQRRWLWYRFRIQSNPRPGKAIRLGFNEQGVESWCQLNYEGLRTSVVRREETRASGAAERASTTNAGCKLGQYHPIDENLEEKVCGCCSG